MNEMFEFRIILLRLKLWEQIHLRLFLHLEVRLLIRSGDQFVEAHVVLCRIVVMKTLKNLTTQNWLYISQRNNSRSLNEQQMKLRVTTLLISLTVGRLTVCVFPFYPRLQGMSWPFPYLLLRLSLHLAREVVFSMILEALWAPKWLKFWFVVKIGWDLAQVSKKLKRICHKKIKKKNLKWVSLQFAIFIIFFPLICTLIFFVFFFFAVFRSLEPESFNNLDGGTSSTTGDESRVWVLKN